MVTKTKEACDVSSASPDSGRLGGFRSPTKPGSQAFWSASVPNDLFRHSTNGPTMN